MDKHGLYNMEYQNSCHLRINLSCVVIILLSLGPTSNTAQTEGDTGYEYNEAYDEYDEESVLGIEPNFDVPIVNVTVVEGQTAMLPCSIEDLGRYKVAWLDQSNMPLTYDERRIVDDFRFTVVRPYINEWNLQIRDISWDDQGQYRCTINTQPHKSKTVVLHIKVPPTIIDELSTNDVTFEEGDTAVLVCNVTGVPRPDVTWYRRPVSGETIPESKMCKSRTVGPEIGPMGEVIILKNVSRYCDDLYECVADNGVPPMVSRQMRVTVEFAPEITMPNTRIGQELGKDTILECIITAFPHAMNSWEKDGMQITSSTRGSSEKYRIQPYEEGQHTITLSLRIHSLQPADYGVYRCIASNSLGSDSQSMILHQYAMYEENGGRNQLLNNPRLQQHGPTPWPLEFNPTYQFSSPNRIKQKEENRYWENTGKTNKLSSSSDSLHRGRSVFTVIACCILATVDLKRLLSSTL